MRYERTPQNGRSKFINIAFVVIAVVVVTAVSYAKSLGELDYKVSDVSIMVERPEEYEETFLFEDIDKFLLIDTVPKLTPIEDKQNKKFYAGRYSSEDFGEIDMYSYKNSEVHIFIEADDGRKLLFNTGDSNTTRSLYISLARMLEEKGYQITFAK